MKILIALMLFVLVSCQTPQDNSPAPINHNKMTLEMQSCNKQEVGLLGCFYDAQLAGSLTIPLWNKGEYQIQSERCSFISNKTFVGTQKLNLTYEELLKNKPDSETSCLFNVKVFLDKFDNGFEGFFLLTKGDIKALEFKYQNLNYNGYAGIQLKETSTALNRLIFKANTPGALFWEGCSRSREIKYEANPSITIEDVINGPLITKESCVLTVGLIPDDENLPVEMAKIHINIYEKTVVNLPQPDLEFKKGKLTVRANSIVAAIAIGEELSVEHGSSSKKFSVKVPYGKDISVRLFTSNGRFMLLNVNDGEVIWIK